MPRPEEDAPGEEDAQSELKERIKRNIGFLYETLGDEKSYKAFGQKVSIHYRTVERLIAKGTISFNHTIPIEAAFELQYNSLRLPYDQFVRYFNSRLTQVPRARPSQAVRDAWEKTISFSEQVKQLDPLLLVACRQVGHF